MQNLFSCRKSFYIAVTLFWLVTMGMLMQRHYGNFHLSGSFSGSDLQDSFIPAEISQEQWMGVYLNGEKIGYLSRKISPAQNGYTMDEAFKVKMLVMGNEKVIETLLNAALDKNLKLLSFTARLKADLDIELSGNVKGRELSLTINSSGVTTTKKISLSKEPILNGPAVTGMLRGLKPGSRISVPVFDPSIMGVEDLELIVSAKEKIMSLGKMQEAYKVNGNMKGIEFTTWITEMGEVLREESPMGFLLVKESKEDALRIARPSLDLLSQAAVPFKIKLPPDISYLKVRLTGIAFTGLDMDGGRQKLIGDVLEINKEVITSRLKTQNTKVRGKPFDEFLSDTIFIQSKDPRIVGLAREIIKDEKDPLVAARLIYDWVYKNIEKVPTITIPMAVDVLKTKKGDCNEHTTLFVALARA
ncbi:MAG: transglutaminase-like domain-containing protein, partial [Thermodesulfovibrionales bacterium]